MYIYVRVKFFIVFSIALVWMLFCTWISIPWINDLAVYIGYPMAWIVVSLIALIPGFMNIFLLTAYLIDDRPIAKPVTEWPNITVMIAALNEEQLIAQTVASVATQTYAGQIEIIVIDNGSTDRTYEILKNLPYPNLVVLQESQKGKSYALNAALAVAKYEYVLTVDADTYLMPDAIQQMAIRLKSTPPDTVSVAGSVYVKNSRESFMTRLQEWDYFHAIAVIKRMQSLFQGTLVAQGAFSLYKKSCVQEVGGWPHTVGEDIVLTWGLLEKGYRIDFSEQAIAFTSVPTTYKAFFYQRSRWSRGMLEAFVAHPKVLLVPRLSTFIIYWDLLFPAMDSTFFFVYLPGLVAALFGYYFLAGPMTIAVLPVTILLNMIFFFGQRQLYERHGLSVRRNLLGFIFYMLFYYPIMLPAIMHGYYLEILALSKSWGTK